MDSLCAEGGKGSDGVYESTVDKARVESNGNLTADGGNEDDVVFEGVSWRGAPRGGVVEVVGRHGFQLRVLRAPLGGVRLGRGIRAANETLRRHSVYLCIGSCAAIESRACGGQGSS